jgi:septum formation topological specificity factor MinE
MEIREDVVKLQVYEVEIDNKKYIAKLYTKENNTFLDLNIALLEDAHTNIQDQKLSETVMTMIQKHVKEESDNFKAWINRTV